MDSSSSITTVHSDIIQSHILTRLDGPTLASAASTSSNLRHLCTEQHLWHKICTATWPSLQDPLTTSLISTFPATHRSIFSDSFPIIHYSYSYPPHPTSSPPPPPPPNELISAVDLHYKGKPVFSKVLRTETNKDWFLCSPFWIDLLNPNEIVQIPVKFAQNHDVVNEWLNHIEENLTLSWIIIEPTRKRAANLSSRSPVTVRRNWLTGELEVVYAVVMGLVRCVITVTCCGKVGGEVHVREVSLVMENMEGKRVIARESMVILQGAMENGIRKKVDVEETKTSFERFCWMKREMKEREMKREKTGDLVVMFVAFVIFALVFRFWA